MPCSLGFSCPRPIHQVTFQELFAFLWRLPVGKHALMRVYIDVLVSVSLGAWVLDPVPVLIKSSSGAYKAEGQVWGWWVRTSAHAEATQGGWQPESFALCRLAPSTNNKSSLPPHAFMGLLLFPELCKSC